MSHISSSTVRTADITMRMRTAQRDLGVAERRLADVTRRLEVMADRLTAKAAELALYEEGLELVNIPAMSRSAAGVALISHKSRSYMLMRDADGVFRPVSHV